MTGVPVNLDWTPPLLANQPGAPTITPQGDHGASLVKELDKLFQNKFIPPTVDVKNRGLVSMPPYSVPVPRAINLARDVFNVSKPIARASILQRHAFDPLGGQTVDLGAPLVCQCQPDRLSRLGAPNDLGIWLAHHLAHRHARRQKGHPSDVHFADYIHRPHEHHAHSMAEIKPLYEKWRHDWVNYFHVIKSLEEKVTTPKPLPIRAPAPKTPVMPSTGIEVLDIFSLYIRTSSA